MPALIVLPEAEQDLIDIWLYIAEDQPVNTDRFLERLEKKTHKLAEFTVERQITGEFTKLDRPVPDIRNRGHPLRLVFPQPDP